MAHQDDEMFCLGTMLRCMARGDKLHFVTLTDGSKGLVQSPGKSREEAAAVRHAEMSELSLKLGAAYMNLAEHDEFLYDGMEIRMKLIEAIRRTGAELIFTHYRDDYNLDHVTTSSLVMHCAMQACLPVLPTTSDPLASHPAIFMIGPHGAFHFKPSHFVDVSLCEERKIELLKSHYSQEDAMRLALGEGFDGLVRRRDAYWGALAGCGYAEAFEPMRSRGAMKPYGTLP